VAFVAGGGRQRAFAACVDRSEFPDAEALDEDPGGEMGQADGYVAGCDP